MQIFSPVASGAILYGAVAVAAPYVRTSVARLRKFIPALQKAADALATAFGGRADC